MKGTCVPCTRDLVMKTGLGPMKCLLPCTGINKLIFLPFVSVTGRLERKYIFGEDIVLSFFYDDLRDCILKIKWINYRSSTISQALKTSKLVL